MKSYIILKLNSGRWGIVEKRSTSVCGKYDTRDEAIKALVSLKEKDKKEREEKKLLKKQTEEMIGFYKDKFTFEGSSVILRSKTKSGKDVVLYGNKGLELRSRKCYTLYINGECIFTSGTIQAAMEYMIKN